jgi:RHS repeat-associated protein
MLDGNGTPRTGNQSAYGNPFTWEGRRLDSETGLMYFRQRMYSTDLGRFVSRYYKPMLDRNWYQFQFSDPAFYVDPMGDPNRTDYSEISNADATKENRRTAADRGQNGDKKYQSANYQLAVDLTPNPTQPGVPEISAGGQDYVPIGQGNCRVYLYCRDVGLGKAGYSDATWWMRIIRESDVGALRDKVHCSLFVVDNCGATKKVMGASWGNSPDQDWSRFSNKSARFKKLYLVGEGCDLCCCIERETNNYKEPGIYGLGHTSNTFPSFLINKCGMKDPFNGNDGPWGWEAGTKIKESKPVSPPSPME